MNAYTYIVTQYLTTLEAWEVEEIEADRLYKDFENFCRDSGIFCFRKRAFQKAMKNCGFCKKNNYYMRA